MKKMYSTITIILTTLGLMASAAWAQGGIGEQVENLIGLWNGGDMAMVAELVAEEYVGHLPPTILPAPLMGREGFGFNLGGWHAGLPDMKLEVLDMVIAEDKAVVRALLSATQTAEFFGIPPTNQPLSFEMVFTYHFDDAGLLAEEWIDWDTTLELIQLGLFTPPGGGN